MLILAIDIGGGTQDILLFDSLKTVENCVKMVMPSPTIALSQKIRAATTKKRSLLFTGVNMGNNANITYLFKWKYPGHLAPPYHL